MQPVVSIPAPPRSRQLGEVHRQEPLRRGRLAASDPSRPTRCDQRAVPRSIASYEARAAMLGLARQGFNYGQPSTLNPQPLP